MITAFARNFSGSAPVSGQGVYFDDGGGTWTGLSYLEGDSGGGWPYSYDLALNGNGYTFSTWVQPNWNSGGGNPVDFGKLETNGDYVDIIYFGYDAETYYDAVYIRALVWFDTAPVDMFFYAPVVDDPYNQGITGLGGGDPSNNWNGNTASQFTHLGFTIHDQAGPPANPGDLSSRAVIYWNGQALKTYESWVGNPNLFSLDGFRNWQVRADVGCVNFIRAHWQDRVSVSRNGIATPTEIQNNYYGNGTPADPVVGVDLHYNFEDPNPFISNGSYNTYELVPTSQSPAADPVLDTTHFVP